MVMTDDPPLALPTYIRSIVRLFQHTNDGGYGILARISIRHSGESRSPGGLE